MAFSTVVDRKARDKIKDLLRDITSARGGFNLAMVAQTSPELPNRWTLIVSAPWIDSVGSRSAVSYLSSKLAAYLDRNRLSAIDRISTIGVEEPILESVWHHGKLDLDDPEVHMRNWRIGSWFIPDGYLFVADPEALSAQKQSH